MQGSQWKGRRRRKTRYRRFRWGKALLVVISVGLVVFALVKLIGYGADYVSSQRTADELRQVYQAETSAPVITTAPAAPPSAAPQASPAPTAAPVAVTLEEMRYANNPRLEISSKFKALRKENKDIVGWLTIGDLLDEAVTQRDEDYYMDHDALGKKNVNGAIFLDSGISLKTRPYTCILYGHNMKTGAMFGCLRNFENIAYYHSEPFITFDTMYESGRYVIFAVSTVNTVEKVRNYVDLFALRFNNIQEREAAIRALTNSSVFSNAVDVQPDDQLLLLVTCVEHDNERRVVAARRVREGENENDLKNTVARSWKK
ncbi:MAG: class B sortase [Clostridia bacterium]|nr:class B sortase [Clostridia bacterium]